MTARPAEFYVVPAGSVMVPARVAAVLNRHAGLDRFRVNVRGTDPEVDAVLQALRVAGVAWSSQLRTGSANDREPEALSEWVTARQAADLLRRTSRAVQKACSNGRLRAEQVGGCWRIRREDLEDYQRSGHGRDAA